MSECDVHPVGLLDDLRCARRPNGGYAFSSAWRRARWQVGYHLRRRDWRGVRSYLNGYLAEHGGHPHAAGRGWTRRAAVRHADRLCRAAQAEGMTP